MTELQPGESLDLNTRCGGGPEIERSEDDTGEFAVDSIGPALYRDEIKRFAEAAGFTVEE